MFANRTISAWFASCADIRSNINALTFNPVNAGLLASCGRDLTVRLWDTESGDELASLPAYGANGAVQFDPTGRYLAIEDQQ